MSLTKRFVATLAPASLHTRAAAPKNALRPNTWSTLPSGQRRQEDDHTGNCVLLKQRKSKASLQKDTGQSGLETRQGRGRQNRERNSCRFSTLGPNMALVDGESCAKTEIVRNNLSTRLAASCCQPALGPLGSWNSGSMGGGRSPAVKAGQHGTTNPLTPSNS